MQHYSGSNPDKFKMSEAIAVAGKIGAFCLAGYVLVAVLGHFVSLKMIFPRPPVSYALTPDFVQLGTPDGEKITTRYWPNPSAKYTVLYLHGNYEDLGGVGEYLPRFVAAGYAAFSMDYRHYGHSTGEPTETNTNADVRMAYRYLRDTLHVPAERILIFGYSLGSGPAVELALDEPAAGLVLQGPYVSAYRVRTVVRLLPGDKFENLAKVPRLKLPVLVIHGTGDGTIPFWHGEAIYAAITSRKEKLFVDGGPHSRLEEYTGEPYWRALKKFTDSLP